MNNYIIKCEGRSGIKCVAVAGLIPVGSSRSLWFLRNASQVEYTAAMASVTSRHQGVSIIGGGSLRRYRRGEKENR